MRGNNLIFGKNVNRRKIFFFFDLIVVNISVEKGKAIDVSS